MHSTFLESRAGTPTHSNYAMLHEPTRPVYTTLEASPPLLWPCSKCNTICRTNYQSKRKELEDTIMCDGFRNVPWKESSNYLVHFLSPIFEQANLRGFPLTWDRPETWVTLSSPGFPHSFSSPPHHAAQRKINLPKWRVWGAEKWRRFEAEKRVFIHTPHTKCAYIQSNSLSLFFEGW